MEVSRRKSLLNKSESHRFSSTTTITTQHINKDEPVRAEHMNKRIEVAKTTAPLLILRTECVISVSLARVTTPCGSYEPSSTTSFHHHVSKHYMWSYRRAAKVSRVPRMSSVICYLMNIYFATLITYHGTRHMLLNFTKRYAGEATTRDRCIHNTLKVTCSSTS